MPAIIKAPNYTLPVYALWLSLLIAYHLQSSTMPYLHQINSPEQYEAAYQKSIEDPAGFWAEIAETFTWRKKWTNVLNWNFAEPKIEWFAGGKMNITENCIDRHLANKGDQPAFIWEANDPDEHHRVLTYRKLHEKVCMFAHVLRNNGVKKGDRVCLYMGMIPELAIAVLACARIGAIHSVIFGGFSAQSIADRLIDAQAEFIITCDGAFRGQKDIPLKSVIDDALIGIRFVKKVIVYTRTHIPVSMIKGRDVWWDDEIKKVETLNLRDFPAQKWMPKIHCSYFILRVVPASQKALCIPVAGTWFTPIILLSNVSIPTR